MPAERTWIPEALTPDEQDYVRACIRRARMRPIARECFSNSQRALLDGDAECRMTYAEGYASSVDDGLTIHHGWLTIGGKVVDLTLRTADIGAKVYVPPRLRDLFKRIGGLAPPNRYVGVEFTRDAVRDFVFCTNQAWGSMRDLPAVAA